MHDLSLFSLFFPLLSQKLLSQLNQIAEDTYAEFRVSNGILTTDNEPAA